MSKVYLGLGTNLGDKEDNLNRAMDLLRTEVGEVLKISKFYVSQAWGFVSDNQFLNAVLLIETQLTPVELLASTQKIERKLGRTSKTSSEYTDRLIDIDILLYDELVINESDLQIPHALMTEREFVLIPLAEIAPDYVHPVAKKTIAELLSLKLSSN